MVYYNLILFFEVTLYLQYLKKINCSLFVIHMIEYLKLKFYKIVIAENC